MSNKIRILVGVIVLFSATFGYGGDWRRLKHSLNKDVTSEELKAAKKFASNAMEMEEKRHAKTLAPVGDSASADAAYPGGADNFSSFSRANLRKLETQLAEYVDFEYYFLWTEWSLKKRTNMNIRTFGTGDLKREVGPLTFGRLLKAHRLGEEMTQVEFAKRIGMSKQSLNDLESGRKSPTIKRALSLAKKMSLLPELVVQVVLQDQVNKEKLKLSVSVKKAS